MALLYPRYQDKLGCSNTILLERYNIHKYYNVIDTYLKIHPTVQPAVIKRKMVSQDIFFSKSRAVASAQNCNMRDIQIN